MKQYVASLLGLLWLIIFPITVQATHYRGAELSLDHVTGTTYTLTITEYYDCGGLTGPASGPSANLTFNAINGCFPATPTPVGPNWAVVSDDEVTPYVPSAIPGGVTNCSGQPGAAVPGIRRLRFSRDYDFAGVAPCPIEIGYGICCRSTTLSNIPNPGSAGWYTRLQIWDYPVNNSSPEWLGPSFIIVDEGMESLVCMAGQDPEGDSLVYELDSVFYDYGVGASYQIGYSTYFPLGTNAPILLDAHTGNLKIPAYGNLIGDYAVAIQVSEYRNGLLVSKTRRDLTISAQLGGPDTNQNPRIAPYGGNYPTPVGATYTDTTALSGSLGVPMTIDIEAIDPEGDVVTMTWSANLAGATFVDQATGTQSDTIIGNDPVGVFSWTPTSPGMYYFNVQLEDPTQYAYSLSDYSYAIYIPDNGTMAIDIGPDSVMICNGDSLWLTPQITNGVPPFSYFWSTAETSDSILVYLQATYFLQVIDNVGATASDTLVLTHSPFQAQAGPDLTICGGQTASIGTTGIPGAVYQWSPAVNLNDPNSAIASFSGPAGTYTYVLSMLDPMGCISIDSVNINVGQDTLTGPYVSVSQDSICSLDTVIVSYTGPASHTIQWFWGSAILISGSGQGPYELSWAGNGPQAINYTVSDGLCLLDDSVVVEVFDACVWPGDADDNGLANNNDLLAIGLLYGSTGSSRPNASLNWNSQPANYWTDTLPSGENAVYADTDGNGLINDDDTLAINLNYGLTHNKSEGSKGGPGDPPLFLAADLDTVSVGTPLTIPIVFGLDTLQVQNVYGLAFTIEYDPVLVDSGSVGISYNGWLGTYGSDLLGLQKDAFTDGKVEVALTRTDLQEITGYGTIASLSIVVIDDLAGKTDIAETLRLNITNVRIIRLDGSEVQADIQGTTIVITDAGPLSIMDGLGTSLKIFPQPAYASLQVELGEAQDWRLDLYTLSGQVVRQISVQQASRKTVSLEGLAEGLYILRIQNRNGVTSRKIAVRR